MKIGNAKQFVNLLRSLSSALIEIKIYIYRTASSGGRAIK